MTNKGSDLKQQRNLTSIAELREKYPFNNGDITTFYNQHQGDDPNSFLRTYFEFRDYHDAIYSLLNFLDHHGDMILYVDFKHRITFEPIVPSKNEPDPKQLKISLRKLTLSVTRKMVKCFKYSDSELKNCNGWNRSMLWGGMAALSYNIGLGPGQEYLKHYNNDVCQASLAVLENMPAFSRMRCSEEIKKHIRLFHT